MGGGRPTSSRRIVGADGLGLHHAGQRSPCCPVVLSPSLCAGRAPCRRPERPVVWVAEANAKAELCSRLLDYSAETRALIVNTATRYSSADIIVLGSGVISNFKWVLSI